MDRPALKQIDAHHAAGAAFVDGAYCPLAEARIPLNDLGFLHADATYDVAHVWNGRFFRLEDHLDRFLASCRKLRFDLPYSRDDIRSVMIELVRLTGLTDAYVNITATRGVPPPGNRDPLACRNRLYGFAIPFMRIARPEEQEAGIAMIVADVAERIGMASFDQTIKNFMWGDLTAAQIEAGEKGAKVPVLLDGEGNITEGPGFNVFVLRGGRLMTPDTGVLHGITRRTVIELAGRLNADIQVRPVHVDELRAADELFITSTAGGIMPVVRLDGKPVGDGEPGPLSRRLREMYWAAHDDPAYTTPVRGA